MGAGKQSIIEGGGKGKDNEAEVSDQALHVKVIGGGGSGPTSDVNIASVGGNPVTTTVPVSGTVSVTEPVSVDDNGGSLTVDGTVAVSSVGGTVTIQEPLSVDDNGGSLTVDGTVAVSSVGGTVTIQEPLSVDDNGGSLTVDGTVAVSSVGGTVTIQEPLSVDDNGSSLTVDTPETESSAVSGGHVVFPAGAVVDADLDGIPASENEWTNLRTDSSGALWTTIFGNPLVTVSNFITQRATATLHNAQVFNNTTTTANGSTLDVSANIGRYILVYYDIAVANAPTSIRLVPQFSLDGGTTWFDYSVDQWVEMRFVPGQMPLKECCPLNYVIGPLFRVRIDAVGTTATATFTVTLKAECID